MTFDPELWTPAELELLHKKLKALVIGMATSGGSIKSYQTEAQSYELIYDMPFPEFVMAVETALSEKQNCGLGGSTRTYIY